MQWDVVIGLEVHVQLNTKSKLFSGSATTFGAEANSQASFIDLALPGVLPVINEEAIRKAIIFGLAVNGNINRQSYFERKNYFYPDLPKGYQTSQLESPIIQGGEVTIEVSGHQKNILLTRAHLEEDAGKSTHLSDGSGIDLNRAGIPLLEIVTEPVITCATEATAYLKTLNQLVQYLDICSGNMQEGAFRADVNLSIKPKGQEALGTRVEIKNLNSYRFIEKAIHYEIDRHIDLLEQGKSIVQETRLYNETTQKTVSMRSKEDANDYRYFPCPDLLPVEISQTMLDGIQASMVELPHARIERLIQTYQLSQEDAIFLTHSKAFCEYFETITSLDSNLSKLAINWLKGEVSAKLNKDDISLCQSKVSAPMLTELLQAIHQQTIPNNTAKNVLTKMWNSGEGANTIIERENLAQNNDSSEMTAIINQVIADNPKQVAEYQAGKTKLLGFFVGQVMKLSKGRANPALINQLLTDALKN